MTTRLILALVAGFLLATSVVGEKQEIVKSKADPRHYRRILLQNGLDMLLIEDPYADACSVAVDVQTGWWNDPAPFYGLAHFLEHMLFLGSRKYTREAAWREYLAQNSGRSNAYTSSMNVNYYFSIKQDALEDAIDMFSHFFVSPLLSMSAVSREVLAVNAEFNKNLKSDEWRKMQLMRNLSSPTLRNSKFSTGNLATLLDSVGGSVEKLHAALVSFYNQYYVAPNMRVVIISTLPVLEAEAKFSKYWRQVPQNVEQHELLAKGIQFPIFLSEEESPASNLNPTPKNSLNVSKYPYVDRSDIVFEGVHGKAIYLDTIQDIQKLTISWAIPPQMPFYESKSWKVISVQLGDEGPGSLFSHLYHEGFATAIWVGLGLKTAEFDLMEIQLSLTKHGLENVKEILVAVNQFIRLIEMDGVKLWRWRENANIATNSFRFMPYRSPMRYGSRLAARMGRMERHRDLLLVNHVHRIYDPPHILSLLTLMTPERMVVTVAAPDHVESGIKLNRVEPYYGTKFAIEDLDLVELRVARNANATEVFALPKPCAFIPVQFALKPIPTAPRMPSFPIVVGDTDPKTAGDSVRLWWKQSTHRLRRPTALMSCKIRVPHLSASARHAALGDLYSWVVRDKANEELFSAQRAGYSYRFRAEQDGFTLMVSGWDSQLEEFVTSLANYLDLSKALAKDRLTTGRVRKRLIRYYHNQVRSMPIRQAILTQRSLLSAPAWTPGQMADTLDQVRTSSLKAFARTLFRDAALECLVSGNIEQHEATKLVNILRGKLNLKSISVTDRRANFMSNRVLQLNGLYQFVVPPATEDDPNSAVYDYYQYEGEGNVEDDVFIHFIGSLIRPVAFNQLRTLEGLGYIVWAGTTVRQGVNAIYVTVQSPKKNGFFLDERVNSFMNHTFRKYLHEFSTEQFQEMFKEAYEDVLARKTSWWKEIVSQEYNFYRWRQEARLLYQLATNPKEGRKRFLTLYDKLIGFNGVPAKVSVIVQTESGVGRLDSNSSWYLDVDTHGMVNIRPKLRRAPRKRQSLLTRDQQQKARIRRLVPVDRDDPALHVGDVATPMKATLHEGRVEVEKDHDATPNFLEVKERLMEASSVLSVDEAFNGAPSDVRFAQVAAGMRFRSEVLPEESPKFEAPCAPESEIRVETKFYKCNRNGTMYELQSRPCPLCSPFPQLGEDLSCHKAGPNHVYTIRPVTYSNIAAFHDGLCLYPKKPAAKFLPTIKWWLERRP